MVELKNQINLFLEFNAKAKASKKRLKSLITVKYDTCACFCSTLNKYLAEVAFCP